MKRALAIVLALLLTCVGACGYDTGFKLPVKVGSIGVEMFGNDSKVRDLEASVHDAVTASLRSRTDAHLVPPSLADMLIRGKVLAYSRRSGIRDENNLLLETGVQIVVAAEIVQLRPTPGVAEAVLKRIRVDEEAGYRLVEPTGEIDARERVLRRIGDRIVLELFAEFTQEAAPTSQN